MVRERDKGREGQWLAVAAARLKVEAGGCNAIFEKKNDLPQSGREDY
jgi:hypothetical protein